MRAKILFSKHEIFLLDIAIILFSKQESFRCFWCLYMIQTILTKSKRLRRTQRKKSRSCSGIETSDQDMDSVQ
ncbi:hypothetical protein AtNW77_Chr5g0113441 [Arabidopsis thaliana]